MVRVFNVTFVADLVALAASVRVHLTVGDFRTTQVVRDFHLGLRTVETLPGALLVHTVVDGSDTHVGIGREELAVVALEAQAVTVVVVAVGDGHHAGPVGGQLEALTAHAAFALVALTALVGAHGLACQRSA